MQEYVSEWHQLPQPLTILHTLGDAGTFLLTYTCSDETFVRASMAYVRHAIDEWTQRHAAMYALTVRELVNNALSRLQRGKSGTFERHSSSADE